MPETSHRPPVKVGALPHAHIVEGGDKKGRTLTCCLPAGCGAEVRWKKGEASPLIAFHRDHKRCATPEALAERNARVISARSVPARPSAKPAPAAEEPPVREFIVWQPGDAAMFSHPAFLGEWRPGRVKALNLPHNVHVVDCENGKVYLCGPHELRRLTRPKSQPSPEAFDGEAEAKIAAFMARSRRSREDVLGMIRAGQITLNSPREAARA